MEKREKMDEDIVQFGFRMERGLLKDIKHRALIHNITANKWVLQAIAEKIMREDKFK